MSEAQTKKRKVLITDYFEKVAKVQKIITGYNTETGSWHCQECGADMGPHNPRQLCGKSICYGYGYRYKTKVF